MGCWCEEGGGPCRVSDTRALLTLTQAGGGPGLGMAGEKLGCRGDRDLGGQMSIPEAEMLRQRAERWAGCRETTHR